MSPVQTIKLLLIEDDREDYLITREIVSMIKNRKFTIDWEPDFSAALEQIKLNAHDIYLVDYNLGARNGVDLINEVQKSGVDTPFIFLTGMNDLDLDVKAMQAGAVDYLIKDDLTPQLLERSIRYSLKQKEIEKVLRDAMNTKDKLFSIISHDLRSPIATLMSTIDVLTTNTEIDDNVKNDLLKELGMTSKSTLYLLENLLSWARNQLDSFTYKTTTIKTHRLVDEIFELHSQQAKQKSIQLINQLDPEQEVIADQNVLTLILRNLISNAIKFTNEGGEVKASASFTDHGLQFSISDTGVGMDQATMNMILELHTFQSSSGTHNEPGSGLGLNIVKDFIDKIGGKFWVDSEQGKGSVFYFSIPQDY